MDCTPTPGMLQAMLKFVDATVGEAPLKSETTTAANKRREAREVAIQFLHNFARLSMREGVARDRGVRGMPITEDEVIPNKLKIVR